MSKPRFLKPLLIGCACLVPIGLVVGLSVNWDHTKTISCIGSGGVKPFVEAFGENFRKNNKGYDVTVESGGSTFAVSQVANGYCNMGDASKNPYKDVHDDSKILSKWNNQSIKTFTLGWEGIGVLYLMPEGLSFEAQQFFDLYVGDENINYLYAAFSGFNEIYVGNEIRSLDTIHTSYYEFLTPTAKNHMTAADLNICKKTQITPIVRSGGATAANSAYSFAMECNLDNVNITPNQKMAFTGGQYGLAREIIQTDESNAKGYKAFDDLKLEGSMVYLTSAFTQPKSTREIIESNKNYKFMSYKPSGTNNYIKYSYENFNEGYEWVRPLNIMCVLNEKNKRSNDNKKFIESIFGNQDTYEAILKKVGAKPLTINQIYSMAIDNNFWVSDTQLEQVRVGEDKEVYGAIK